MAKEGGTEYTIKQMQELTNLSYSAVYKLLHGYQSRGTTQSGLLEKCPAISFTDRTVTSDDDVGRSVRRRAHAYQFNLGAYRHWSSGGAVWLGPGNDHDDPDEAGNSADGSTFPETAANIIEGETGVETGNKQFNKKIFINNSTKSGNSENKEPEGPGEGSTPVCVCESESASNEIDHGAFHSPISKIPPKLPLPLAAHSAKMQKLQQTALFCSTYRAVITRCLTFPSPGPYAPCAAIRVRNMLKSRRLNGRRGQIVRLSGSVRSVIKRHGSGNRVKVLLSRVFLRSTGWRIFQTILAVVRFATSKKRCTSTGRRERVSVSTVTTVRTG